MTTPRKRSTRALVAVLVGCVAFAVVAPSPLAGATVSAPRHEAPVQGFAGPLVEDPTCPHDPAFPTGSNYRQRLTGLTLSRVGPAGVAIDACRVFVGAMGGQAVRGSFTLVSFLGTLRGSVDGTVGFNATDNYTLVLHVEHASRWLSGVGGTLTFTASTRPKQWFRATLTSELTRAQ